MDSTKTTSVPAAVKQNSTLHRPASTALSSHHCCILKHAKWTQQLIQEIWLILHIWFCAKLEHYFPEQILTRRIVTSYDPCSVLRLVSPTRHFWVKMLVLVLLRILLPQRQGNHSSATNWYRQTQQQQQKKPYYLVAKAWRRKEARSALIN